MKRQKGNRVTLWVSAEYTQPNDGEYVVFHIKGQRPDEWLRGYYDAGSQQMRIPPTAGVYWTFPWDSVDYWMRIPPVV